MSGPSEAMKAAFPPMTNEELADALQPTNEELAEFLDNLLLIPKEDRLKRDHAAQRLRDMPEGERIEGIVVEESRDFKTNKLNRVVLEARDGDMADPTRYACATLIFHTRQKGESDE